MIKAVRYWVRLSSVIEIQSFLGLAGYQTICTGVLLHCILINQIDLEGNGFQCFDKVEVSFQKLKNFITYCSSFDSTRGEGGFCHIL